MPVDAAEAAPTPLAFAPVTVKVTVPTGIPVTVIGEDDPLAVCPVDAVTVNPVAGTEPAGKENDTIAEPLLYGLFVPTSVAVTLIGALGGIKSFCAKDFFPALLFCAIIYIPYYARRSP
jgi:hypothetical protein